MSGTPLLNVDHDSLTRGKHNRSAPPPKEKSLGIKTVMIGKEENRFFNDKNPRLSKFPNAMGRNYFMDKKIEPNLWDNFGNRKNSDYENEKENDDESEKEKDEKGDSFFSVNNRFGKIFNRNTEEKRTNGKEYGNNLEQDNVPYYLEKSSRNHQKMNFQNNNQMFNPQNRRGYKPISGYQDFENIRNRMGNGYFEGNQQYVGRRKMIPNDYQFKNQDNTRRDIMNRGNGRIFRSPPITINPSMMNAMAYPPTQMQMNPQFMSMNNGYQYQQDFRQPFHGGYRRPGRYSRYKKPDYHKRGGYRNQHRRNYINRPKTQTEIALEKLLQQIKGNNAESLVLKDYENFIVELCKDQSGSRFIQKRLEGEGLDSENNENSEKQIESEKNKIFESVFPSIMELTNDVFGNYVIQKFFEFGSERQIEKLVEFFNERILFLSKNKYGCRVIQKALEIIERPEKDEILAEIEKHCIVLVEDQNGNHVIQKCIETLKPEGFQFIVDAFEGKVKNQAMHCYGCRVIQRLLEYSNKDQSTMLLDEIELSITQLITNQYGNYVIQHLLKNNHRFSEFGNRVGVISIIKDSLISLCFDKFASNCIEKCFEYGTEFERSLIIKIVCSTKDKKLIELMNHRFANYVIQKLIKLANKKERKSLQDKLNPLVARLTITTFGKHIVNVLRFVDKEKK